MATIFRRTRWLAGVCLALTAQAACARLPVCQGEQDPGPCTVTQSAPFKHIKLKPGMNVHAVDKHVIVSWAGPAQRVVLDTLDVPGPMPLMDRDLWQVVIRYQAAPRFKSSVYFKVTRRDGTVVEKDGDFYGPEASRTATVKATPAQALALPATLPGARVWLPPGYRPGRRYPIVYVADSGDNRGALAAAAIRKGELEPVIVVGLDSCAKADAGDEYCRTHHYVETYANEPIDAARFGQYEKFFIHTVVAQVEARYGAPADASQRAVTGYSAGGAWAASMALRHPELFGRAIVMSPAGDMLYRIAPKTGTVFALSGGDLEPDYAKHAQCFAGAIADVGGTATLRLYPAGHSELMWAEEFMAAMKDWLGRPRAPIQPAPTRPAWCPALDKV